MAVFIKNISVKLDNDQVAAAVHAFNPSIWEAETEVSEANLVYSMNSKTARATQRNLTQKQNKQTKKKSLPP